MTNDDSTFDELTREQILDLADAEGKKLGFLLATCPLDDKTKKGILQIIEKATPEQLAVITQFFEEGYLMAQNKDLNDWLEFEFENITHEFDKKEKALDDDTIAKMDVLEKSLSR